MPCCSCSWPIFCTWNELCWGQLLDFKGNQNDRSSLPVIICLRSTTSQWLSWCPRFYATLMKKHVVMVGHTWLDKTWSVWNARQTRVFSQWKSYVRPSIQPPDLCPPWHICTSNLRPFTSFAETEHSKMGGLFKTVIIEEFLGRRLNA